MKNENFTFSPYSSTNSLTLSMNAHIIDKDLVIPRSSVKVKYRGHFLKKKSKNMAGHSCFTYTSYWIEIKCNLYVFDFIKFYLVTKTKASLVKSTEKA